MTVYRHFYIQDLLLGHNQLQVLVTNYQQRRNFLQNLLNTGVTRDIEFTRKRVDRITQEIIYYQQQLELGMVWDDLNKCTF